MEGVLLNVVLIGIATAILPVAVIIVLFLLRGERGLPKAIAFVAGSITVRIVQGILFGYIFVSSADSHGDALVVEFPGNRFKGDIVPALIELTERGTIRILDLLFVKKDADGNVDVFELDDLPSEEAAAFEPLEGEIDDLLNEEDSQRVAAALPPNSSAGVLVFENVWATRLANAIADAGGRVVDNVRVPAAVVEAAFAAVA